MIYSVLVILLLCIVINLKSIEGFKTFGFNVHHRYSDTVKEYLDRDGLPEKGSLDYYAAMAHRDQLFNGRRLQVTTNSSSPQLTFMGSNATYRLSGLGFLHYSIVSVGTPALTFLVALDTGSDLFWLPCDCTNCVRSLNLTSGRTLDLNIYNLNTSSTSSAVPCNSTFCNSPERGCAIRRNACAYQENYLSSNTSSTGIYVDDILHLGTDRDPQNPVEAPIRLGCGIIQTGDFVDGAAINGLFGLGMSSVSVPSTLASTGLTSNSFSMCFGPDGLGRIEFGDKGSPNQNITRFNIRQSHPTYNVTVTQIVVGDNVTDLEFTAIFDSGTSFTYLNDPAYSAIAESFNSQITEPRYQPDTQLIFDYCYSLSPTQDGYTIPYLNLIMNGGSQFSVNAPTIQIDTNVYCLALVRSTNINIIGQNFMSGYRIVFDREEMTLGWTESDCYDSISFNGTTTLPVDRNNTADGPSPFILNPEATPANRTRFPTPSNHAIGLSSTNKFLMVMFSIIFFLIL